MVSSKDLAKALYKISKEENQKPRDILDSFFKYIDDYKLQSLLPKVLKYLEEFYKTDSEFNSLQIKVSHQIDDELTQKICNVINTQTSDIRIIEDKELIGGFIANHKGFIYDASIKNQLQLLKQQLIKS